MATHIFYGAGQNAREHLSEWQSRGISPVCFADCDDKKQHTKFVCDNGGGGAIDILPIDEAISRYPDSDIYITPVREKWESIAAFLCNQGVPAAKIKFFQPVEYRRGCPNIGSCFIAGNKIGCCCVPGYRANFEFEQGPDHGFNFQKYEETTRAIISNWRNGLPSVCDGCPNLSYGIWDIDPQIQILNISSKDGSDFCNTKCIYCSQFPKPEQSEYEKRGREVVELLETAHERYPERTFRVVLSGGDISVAPFRDKALAILEKYGWAADLYSNSVLYCEGVSRQLRGGQSTYVTTLDSMVPQKFAQIKGVDCLPKVLENIRRYSEAAIDTPRQIKIKFIVLDGVYSTFEEMSGVVDFAAGVGARLMLSCDVERAGKRLSRPMFDFTVQWIRRALGQGVRLDIMYDHFNVEDAADLKKQFG